LGNASRHSFGVGAKCFTPNHAPNYPDSENPGFPRSAFGSIEVVETILYLWNLRPNYYTNYGSFSQLSSAAVVSELPRLPAHCTETQSSYRPKIVRFST